MKKLNNEDFDEILSYEDIISRAERDTLHTDTQVEGEAPAIMDDRKFIEFLDALNYTGFIERFDYMEWASKKDGEDPGSVSYALDQINHADLDELRKMMTMHIRMERFAEGHMQQLYEHGFFDRFFERVKELK